MVGIYKITNTITNLCYIGQSIDIKDRWLQHSYNATHKVEREKNRKLYIAFHQFGLTNFTFEVLEECELTQSVLNERERYWIEYYDSYNNGYNMTKGGQGEDSWIYDPAIIRQLWDDGYSFGEIISIVGCSKRIVQKRLKGYNDYNASTSHSRGALRAIQEGKMEHLHIGKIYNFSESQKVFFFANIPVHQYDLAGNYINSFNSLSEAARAMGKTKPGSETNISKAIYHKDNQRIAYGYQWSREKIDKLPPVPAHLGKLVRCIETGQVFPSTVAAAHWANLKSKSGVRECCVGIVKSAGKHPETGEKLHWEYVE